jgi:two-component system, NarL family, sensor kinase
MFLPRQLANYLKRFTQQPLKTQGLILCWFAVVIVLEYATPPAYVFGYLYIGAVLLANPRLSRETTSWVIIAASALTLLNLAFPANKDLFLATIANRLIAVVAIAVTGWLSNKNHDYQEAIARQQVKLLAQEKLASLREDFASTLTHDLKTPLLGAIETLHGLEGGKFGTVTPSQRRVIDIMTRSHRTTLQLVETLLDVYRNDTEGLKLQRQPLALVSVAEEAISTLTELASTRQVYIHLGYGDSDFRKACWVNGDELQLQRVFVNLIANGINHSLRGGKVEVIFTSRNNEQIVQIRDEGQGITDNELQAVFERFYQGHSDRQAKGSGLGLYLSRQIIEAHGGKIWVEQRVPRGAIFGFRLPSHLPMSATVDC